VAQRWDREVGSPFEHIYSAGARDGEPGAFYHTMGFRKSFAGVWGPASLNFYADMKQSGRELHPSLGQDVHMLGGDLLVGSDGRMLLPYYSKDNRDRPSIQTLLDALQTSAKAQPESASATTAPADRGCSAPVTITAAVASSPQRPALLSLIVVGAVCLAMATALARRKQ